jgi:hypothetical protein
MELTLLQNDLIWFDTGMVWNDGDMIADEMFSQVLGQVSLYDLKVDSSIKMDSKIPTHILLNMDER